MQSKVLLDHVHNEKLHLTLMKNTIKHRFYAAQEKQVLVSLIKKDRHPR